MNSKHVFKYVYDPRDEGKPTHIITHETYSVSLPEIIMEFEQYLRGTGFNFTGSLEIVQEDEE